MGVSISSESFSQDIGYGGFKRFRTKVAELTNSEFGNHYKKLENASFLMDEEREKYFKQYDDDTQRMVDEGIVTAEIANFCYQSDCGGEIDQEQAKQIYEVIKDYNDNICYGYAGKKDCTMFSDLKDIFKDCAENGDTVSWY